MDKKELKLNLICDEETNRVVYAWAGKDFIDVLFSVLTLPLASLASIVERPPCPGDSFIGSVRIGCINSLLDSLKILSPDYLQKGHSKKMLLNPENTSESHFQSLKLNLDPSQPTQFFMCSTHCKYSVISDSQGNCVCGRTLMHKVHLKHSGNGFVRNTLTNYIIKDDLTVVPFTVDSCSLSLLEDTGLINTGSLVEESVDITKPLMLDFLKCCLLSTTPLTSFWYKKIHIVKRNEKQEKKKEEKKQDEKKKEEKIDGLVEDYDEEEEKTEEEEEIVEEEVVVKEEEEEGQRVADLNIKLNLLLNKADGTIVSANVGDDFVELLLTFLTYPLGSVVNKLNCNSGLGGIDSLYKSAVNLSKVYSISTQAIDCLIQPPVAHYLHSNFLLLPHDKQEPKFYCYSVTNPTSLKDYYVTKEEHPVRDPVGSMVFELKSATEKDGESKGRILKGPSMYVVHRNLTFDVLKPSIQSLQALVQDSGDFNCLTQKTIIVGRRECLKVLEASLTSQNALQDGLRGFLGEVCLKLLD
ncbi:hypothetical protein OROMI_029044 [Orobanche minor]